MCRGRFRGNARPVARDYFGECVAFGLNDRQARECLR